MVIGGGSMEPAIGRGAFVLALPAGAEGYARGRRRHGPAGRRDAVHASDHPPRPTSPASPYVETKGDANAAPDPAIVPTAAIIGRVALSIPLLGYLVMLLATAAGLAGFLAVCATMLILVWVIEELEDQRCPECAAVAAVREIRFRGTVRAAASVTPPTPPAGPDDRRGAGRSARVRRRRSAVAGARRPSGPPCRDAGLPRARSSRSPASRDPDVRRGCRRRRAGRRSPRWQRCWRGQSDRRRGRPVPAGRGCVTRSPATRRTRRTARAVASTSVTGSVLAVACGPVPHLAARSALAGAAVLLPSLDAAWPPETRSPSDARPSPPRRPSRRRPCRRRRGRDRRRDPGRAGAPCGHGSGHRQHVRHRHVGDGYDVVPPQQPDTPDREHGGPVQPGPERDDADRDHPLQLRHRLRESRSAARSGATRARSRRPAPAGTPPGVPPRSPRPERSTARPP